ncbi:hypothetical protein [Burkholderia sp. BDU5]|uniref:hypothetical protein n=1 Tax=Burkholderia sp. BDU5 TaxID=1385590 RepID=UPI000A5F00C7|nr:hypothetical protein [Burkholderia sp. BDU5]
MNDVLEILGSSWIVDFSFCDVIGSMDAMSAFVGLRWVGWGLCDGRLKRYPHDAFYITKNISLR